MVHSVELSEKAWRDASQYASVYSRSVPEQVEFWLSVGKIAEENPDLPYEFIKNVLMSKQQADAGELTEYQFG